MSKLPAETLIEIFKFLHFQQKLECMLVCRAWAQILRVYLLETIELSATTTIPSFNRRLHSLMKIAKIGAQPGTKCKRFRIHKLGGYNAEKISAETVATSFPNLKFLQSDYNINYPKAPFYRVTSIELEPETESDPFAGWRTNLETLIDECFDTHTFSNILTTGVFSRLTTLTVLPRIYISSSYYYPWFSKLRNAPALTSFTINGTCISFEDLEELHKSAPKLTSLTLVRGFDLDSGSDLKLLSIMPAEKMKAFKTVDINGSYGSNADPILQYAKMKYPNLDEFSHLECTYSENNHSAFSESGWDEFIPVIGPGLTKCTINQRLKSNVLINLIGKHMTQLEHLDILMFMDKKYFRKVTSSQALYSLVSLSLDCLPRDFELARLKKFTKLKELNLDFSNISNIYEKYHTIVFDDIVDELPKNIDMLCLKYIIITLASKVTQNYSNIVQFKLCDSMMLDKKTSEFMTQHFPMLESLILNRCDLNSSFELPTHHFSYVYITLSTLGSMLRGYRKSIERCKDIKITMNDRTRTYRMPIFKHYDLSEDPTDGSDWTIERALKASNIDDDSRCFHFACASVEKFCYHNYFLLL